MADVRIRMEGAAQVERALRRVEPRLRGRPLARALRKTLNPVRQAVRNAARTLFQRRSGGLARSVRIRVRRLRRFAGMTGVVGFGRSGAQANLLELGTRTADGRERIQASHFVRDAYREHEDALPARLGKEIFDAVARELKR